MGGAPQLPRGEAVGQGREQLGRLEIVDQQLSIAPMGGEVRLDRDGRLRHRLGRREEIGQEPGADGGRRRRRRSK